MLDDENTGKAAVSHVYCKGWWEVERLAQFVLFSQSRVRTVTRSSVSQSDVGVGVGFCNVNLWRADRDLLEKLVFLQHARQIVDSLRKCSYLSNSPFRVFHLFQVVKVFLVDPDAPLEAAAFGHFHI